MSWQQPLPHTAGGRRPCSGAVTTARFISHGSRCPSCWPTTPAGPGPFLLRAARLRPWATPTGSVCSRCCPGSLATPTSPPAPCRLQREAWGIFQPSSASIICASVTTAQTLAERAAWVLGSRSPPGTLTRELPDACLWEQGQDLPQVPSPATFLSLELNKNPRQRLARGCDLFGEFHEAVCVRPGCGRVSAQQA